MRTAVQPAQLVPSVRLVGVVTPAVRMAKLLTLSRLSVNRVHQAKPLHLIAQTVSNAKEQRTRSLVSAVWSVTVACKRWMWFSIRSHLAWVSAWSVTATQRNISVRRRKFIILIGSAPIPKNLRRKPWALCTTGKSTHRKAVLAVTVNYFTRSNEKLRIFRSPLLEEPRRSC